MDYYIIIGLVIILSIVFGLILTIFIRKKSGNELAELAVKMNMQLVETKYAKGIVGKYKGYDVMILIGLRDAATSHVLQGVLNLYMKTDWPAQVTTDKIDKMLLDSVPKNISLQSGLSIFKGSALELVMTEYYKQPWQNLYLIAAPQQVNIESINEKFEEMKEFITRN